MSVITRSRIEQHAFNERRWVEIMAESLDGSISKIETDREGNVIMSPSAESQRKKGIRRRIYPGFRFTIRNFGDLM